MAIPDYRKATVVEFLDWAFHQEERHELVDGVAYLMAGAKQGHNVIASNVQTALVPAGKRKNCRTTSSDTAVQTGPSTIRFPDVVVDCGPADPTARTASHPTIIVEVSSPGTVVVDETGKLEEYRALAGVETVLQIESEIVLVKVHTRQPDGSWTAATYESLGDIIALPRLSTSLSLAEIYDTLTVRPRTRLQVVEDGKSPQP